MLLGNYTVLAKNPGRSFGGSTVSDARSNFNKSGPARGMYSGWAGIGQSTSVPNGYSPGYAWVIAKIGGGMAAGTTIRGTAATSANLAGGLNAVAPLTGTGSVTNASLALIVAAVAALTGAGSVSAANLNAILAIVSSLAGTGDLVAAIKAIGFVTAPLTGTGTITASTGQAGAFMSANINVTGDLLSTANVGAAVWSKLIESGISAEELMRIFAGVLAGKSSGGGTTSIAFRDLTDTKNRIVATVDAQGNRNTVVVDPL